MVVSTLAYQHEEGVSVLSVDPGVARVGWSVLHDLDPDVSIVTLGVMVDKSDKSHSFNERMNEQINQFKDQFQNIIDTYHVDRVVWEIVPSFSTGYGSQARVLATATTLKVITFQNGLPFMEMSPQRWHKMLLGRSKNVSKSEVISKIQERFPELDQLSPDEADSIGIGISALDSKEEEWKHFDKV